MKNNLIVLIFFMISISSLGQGQLNKDVEELFNTLLENKNIKSGMLHVYSKSKGIDIQLRKSGSHSLKKASTPTPFYTASITKMFTATAIGILKDRKLLNFEDTIDQYLPKPLVNKLHVFAGIDYTNKITIAHLLQHTSGLADYFTDPTNDGSPNIINQLLVDTSKFWSAKEMIEFTKEKMKPLFIPGKSYHYTDTAYVLLSLIIEKVSGVSLDVFFKQSIFRPLKMHSSYINLKSTSLKDVLPIAKFYAGEIELSTFKSLSADWGGGGLASTTQDLIRFFEAYNNDKVVKKDTRLEMQQWINETVGMDYGFGIRKVIFKKILDKNTDLQLIGHTGSTASFMWFCPQMDTYITGTLNQLEASKNTLNLVYNILKTIEKKQ